MSVNATGPEARDNAVVSYSVKDLLAKISGEMTEGFARLSALLDGKADKADLAHIEGTLTTHRAMIDGLTQRQALDDQARATATQINDNRITQRRWFWPLMVGALSTVILGVTLALSFVK